MVMHMQAMNKHKQNYQEKLFPRPWTKSLLLACRPVPASFGDGVGRNNNKSSATRKRSPPVRQLYRFPWEQAWWSPQIFRKRESDSPRSSRFSECTDVDPIRSQQGCMA